MIQNLHPGIFYIPNILSQDFKEKIFSWYEENEHLFYTPVLKTGHKMNLKMLCLGKHWNPLDNKYYDSRIDFDQMAVSSIPQWMLDEAENFRAKLFPHHTTGLDICVANAYIANNRLGLHKDSAESKETIDSGYPVISFSFGFSADFNYQLGKDMKIIKINDGDVFAFGDESRLLRHGINKVYLTENKPSLFYNRINLTFRKF